MPTSRGDHFLRLRREPGLLEISHSTIDVGQTLSFDGLETIRIKAVRQPVHNGWRQQ